MQPKGASQKKVLDELKKLHFQEKNYRDGKIFCSMCTQPHPLAKKAHQMFFASNLGDSGLFAGSLKLEKEVIVELASLLHSVEATGFLVSGGTEANLMALFAARNKAKVTQPEVILAQSAHFSFTKICNMLSLKPIYVGLDSTFKMCPTEVAQKISSNTVAIVGTAGTAELGTVDPIEELSEIALAHETFLHVDAAFGGLVIPFLDGKKPQFDFCLDGVQSITVDPHKMGMAAIPTGGILFRNLQWLNYIKTESPYLTNKIQYTFTGTRSGASAASAWAVFKHLGVGGFRKIVGDCMRNTKFLADELKKIGFTLLTDPSLNLVAFRSDKTSDLAQSLWKVGWCISYVPRYDCVRVVVMPHVKRKNILAFLEDLAKIEKL